MKKIILIPLLLHCILGLSQNNRPSISNLFIQGVVDTSFSNIESISNAINKKINEKNIHSITILDDYKDTDINSLVCYVNNKTSIDICNLSICLSNKDTFNYFGEKHSSLELQNVIRENMTKQISRFDMDSAKSYSSDFLVLQIFIRAGHHYLPSSKEWLLLFRTTRIYIDLINELRNTISNKKYGDIVNHINAEASLNIRKKVPIRIAINFIDSECSIIHEPDSPNQNIYDIIR